MEHPPRPIWRGFSYARKSAGGQTQFAVLDFHIYENGRAIFVDTKLERTSLKARLKFAF
jgi:hypothetical protein